MRTIMILSDSLNRRFLNAYGAEERVLTPNIDRLAARSVVFENHWCGSAPCMPARRDILTGRLNFLERPWGGVEPFDHTLPNILRDESNTYTHMETDHFHYAERGGENYWGHFTSWNLHRGTEHDTIFWGPDKNGIPHPVRPEGHAGIYSPSYEATRARYAQRQEEYSTPRTFTAAAQWLEKHHDADNFLLWVEGFDPHEPFDVPQTFLDLYDEAGPGGSEAYWPGYNTADHYTQEEIASFRRRYKALVTMTDAYIGRLLDVLDRYGMWEDTMVILTTDHGYMLGEHGFMAKNYMPDYNEVFHIPLMIAMPGVKPARTAALTQNIDLFPTILSYFGVPESACRNPIHGKSLLPLLRGETACVHDALLFGVFGKTVSVYDGRYVYMRRTVSEQNEPLFLYGSMMTLLNAYIGYDTMSDEEILQIETGRFLPWTNYPVYKVPARCCHWKSRMAFEHINDEIPQEHLLFDLEQDYAQEQPVQDEALEARMCALLKEQMLLHDSPQEQFTRLGI